MSNTTVGSSVSFFSRVPNYDPDGTNGPYPAIVTSVQEENNKVGLTVTFSSGSAPVSSVQFIDDRTRQDGAWWSF